MSFISVVFIVFLLITTTIYFLVPSKSQWIVLLFASYLFYFTAGIELAVFLLSTTIIVYWAGKALGKLNQEYRDRLKYGTDLDKEKRKLLKASVNRRKKRIVAVMLIINFGILFVLKY